MVTIIKWSRKKKHWKPRPVKRIWAKVGLILSGIPLTIQVQKKYLADLRSLLIFLDYSNSLGHFQDIGHGSFLFLNSIDLFSSIKEIFPSHFSVLRGIPLLTLYYVGPLVDKSFIRWDICLNKADFYFRSCQLFPVLQMNTEPAFSINWGSRGRREKT